MTAFDFVFQTDASMLMMNNLWEIGKLLCELRHENSNLTKLMITSEFNRIKSH